MRITKVKPHTCIVKSSYELYSLLMKRWAYFEVKTSQIVEDAQGKGIKIDLPMLSRYMNQWDDKRKKIKEGTPANLPQETIIWLCERYGIGVKVDATMVAPIKTPYAIDNKIKLK